MFDWFLFMGKETVLNDNDWRVSMADSLTLNVFDTIAIVFLTAIKKI